MKQGEHEHYEGAPNNEEGSGEHGQNQANKAPKSFGQMFKSFLLDKAE